MEARGQVEKWLLQLETIMRKSIRKITIEGLESYPTSKRVDWITSWPGQVVLSVTQKYWTANVHKALQEGPKAMADYLAKCSADILDVVELVRGKLSKNTRTSLGALVVLDVHARDVLAKLVEDEIASDDDFAWLCQLRYYFEEEEVCTLTHSLDSANMTGLGDHKDDQLTTPLWIRVPWQQPPPCGHSADRSMLPYPLRCLGASPGWCS